MQKSKNENNIKTVYLFFLQKSVFLSIAAEICFQLPECNYTIAILCQSVSQSVCLSVRSDFSQPLGARKLKFGTNDAYVTNSRREKGFFKISIFRPFFAENTPFCVFCLLAKQRHHFSSDFDEILGVAFLTSTLLNFVTFG